MRPRTHRARAYTPDQILHVILSYNPCEFEVLFNDYSEFSCDCHEGFWRCTWWFPHAYNDPRRQTIYFDTDKELVDYLKGKMRRGVIEARILRDGEVRHIISFPRVREWQASPE